jgi:hypothetical protein
MTMHTTAMMAKTSLPPPLMVTATVMIADMTTAKIPSTMMGTRCGKDKRRYRQRKDNFRMTMVIVTIPLTADDGPISG